MALGTVNVGQARDDSNLVKREEIGVPGGLATLGADGKLTVSQQPVIDHYTQAETQQLVTDNIATHNADTAAHPEIRALVDAVEAEVKALELAYNTDVTQNAFTVSFANLDDVNVTGVWNADQARVEF